MVDVEKHKKLKANSLATVLNWNTEKQEQTGRKKFNFLKSNMNADRHFRKDLEILKI